MSQCKGYMTKMAAALNGVNTKKLMKKFQEILAAVFHKSKSSAAVIKARFTFSRWRKVHEAAV